MRTPSRNQALLAAAVAGVSGVTAWAQTRRTAAASAQRRSRTERGRRVVVEGSSGGRIEARVHGPEDGRTIVLIHCWTGTQELWHKQVDALAGELRMVTYDHRGHGISDPAPDDDYSLAGLAGDLNAVIAATVPTNERPLLAGHSLGAMTLAAWADDCTGEVAERCSGVALLSAGLEGLGLESRVVRALPGPFDTFRGLLADLVLGSPGPITAIPLPLTRAAAAYAALGRDARDEDVELTARMALDCRPRARAGCGNSMARMDLSHAVEALEVPGIVIAGGSDLMTPIAHAERIETALPRSLGLRVDPDAGHMTPLESPELVNDALRELARATAFSPSRSPAKPRYPRPTLTSGGRAE